MYEQIARNRRASWLLMIIVVGLLCLLGYVIGFAWIGGTSGGLGLLGVFGMVAIVWSLVGYYAGAGIVLAVSGAHRVDHDQEPRLYNVVEEMTIAAGLPQPPAVYVIEDAAPNAFATGRDPAHASITVTRGLLTSMDRDELQGVIAHEMSHIRNYDIRFATLVGILVGMIALLADVFLRSTLVRLRRTPQRQRLRRQRRRHHDGGRHRARHTGAAGRLRRAVRHLAAPRVPGRRHGRGAHAQPARPGAGAQTPSPLDPRPLRMANRATAHLYIANPLRKTREVAGLFDTHPPIQKRIGVLLAMAHAGPDALAAPPAQARRRRCRRSPARRLGRRRRARGLPQFLERLAVQVGRRLEGAGQPQVGPRFGAPPQLPATATQGVLRVVVVRRVAHDVAEQLGGAVVASQGELGAAQRLADGVAARLQAQRLREQHGGLRRMPLAQKAHAALKECVGLALGLEGGLDAPGHHARSYRPS